MSANFYICHKKIKKNQKKIIQWSHITKNQHVTIFLFCYYFLKTLMLIK
jgi:hypothetical protein